MPPTDSLETVGSRRPAAAPAASLDALRRGAAEGRTEAMVALGSRLLIGADAPAAPAEGVAHISAAADQGDAAALLLMSTLTPMGLTGDRNWAACLDYLARAAIAGSAEASSQLLLLAGAAPADAAATDAWRRLAEAIDVAAWLRPPERQPVCERPRVRMVRNFAPPAVCDWLRRRAEGRMRPAMMYHGETKQAEIDPHRTCSDYQFDVLNTDVVLLLVRARIAALTQLPTVAMEPPRIFHYATGEEIKPHYDRCGDSVGGYGREGGYLGDRIVTFLLYLNDDFEGGELDFPKVGFQCKGAKGDGVYFAHIDGAGEPEPLSLHAGLPIRSGEKWVLSQWIHDRPFGVAAPAGG